MIVSSVASPDRQPRLFDEPLGGHGHVRTLIGAWTENLLARLLGCVRHRTDCRADYCPDLSSPTGGCYYETKAAGRTRQTFVYGGRLVKDRMFVDAGYQLAYAVLHHGCRTGDYHTTDALQEAFFESLRCLYVVPFADFERIAFARGETPLNSQYGHSDTNPVYGSGYRIPLADLAAFQILDLRGVKVALRVNASLLPRVTKGEP